MCLALAAYLGQYGLATGCFLSSQITRRFLKDGKQVDISGGKFVAADVSTASAAIIK